MTYSELRSTALIAVAALLAGVILILFVGRIAEVVLVFYVSVVLSHALEPIVGFGEKHRIPRVLTIVAVYLILLAAFALLLFLVVPPLIVQLIALAESLPQTLLYLEMLLESYRLLAAQSETAAIIEAIVSRLGQELIGVADALLVLPVRLTGVVLILVSIPIISLYWLINSVRIENTFISLLPEGRREEARDILCEMARKTGAYIRGEGIAMFTVGMLTYVGLSVLGVNYALILGVLAGLMEIIPFVGPPLSAVPAVIIALLVSPILAAEVVVLYIVVQQIESNVLIPNVMHREVGLHPLVVIAALWIGGSILGFLGAILAIPASASLVVLIERVLFPWVRSWRW